METILINGQPQLELSVTDRAFHYGDGVFETIACFHGAPRFWEHHMARLQQGCERLRIPVPDRRQLHDEVTRLAFGESRCVIKIIVTRGSGGRGYRLPQPVIPTRVVIRYPFPNYPEAYEQEGAVVRLCDTPLACNPRLAGIKHLNRLEQILARSEWEDESIVEGWMLDEAGNLIDGTMSNLFVIKQGELYTPELAKCGVSGVMREVVLELARKQQITVHIKQIPATMLERADELFITNSLIAIWPVKRYGARDYPIGPLTRRLQDALAPLLESVRA